MKELSHLYRMEQITHLDHETKPGQKAVKHHLHNLEDADLTKMVGSMTTKITPFNYEPYVLQSGIKTLHYGATLANELKIPNSNYCK